MSRQTQAQIQNILKQLGVANEEYMSHAGAQIYVKYTIYAPSRGGGRRVCLYEDPCHKRERALTLSQKTLTWQ